MDQDSSNQEAKMTGRERVIKALDFDHPDRAPRDLWWLPAVEITQKEELENLLQRFPIDIGTPTFSPGVSNRGGGLPFMPRTRSGGGARTALPRKGKYVDEWGSIWQVGEDGLIGQVKGPALGVLAEVDHFSPPWEYLESTDLDEVNRSCALDDRFMLSDICARPFERMQFLLGTQEFFLELAYGRQKLFTLREMVHEYDLSHIRMWLATDVDGIFMMDDWGAQDRLLISPKLWREFLKPLYREYCDLVHEHGKYVFFHSDGYIEPLFDDLIEIGVDALNCQLFCMDVGEVANRYRGRITFWGEIDRQRLLPFGHPSEIRQAVYQIRRLLGDGKGGVIAQCEWGKDNPRENIEAVFSAWSDPLPE